MKNILKKIKTSLNLLLKPFNQEIISSSYLKSLEKEKDQTFSNHLKSLFKSLKIDCVLDVGANKGQYSKFLRRQVGYQGLILSFEPIPENVKILQNLAEDDPYWFIYDYALGSQDTTQIFNVMKKTVFSSFLKPISSQIIKNISEENQIAFEIEVVVQKLDSILEQFLGEHSFNHIYLKMDTQGYDLEVVKGAEMSLPSISALQTEVSFEPLYNQMPSFLETYEIMKKKGFELTGLFPVVRDSSLRMIEGDCVMVNCENLLGLDSQGT